MGGSFSKAGEPCGKVQLIFLSDSGGVRADVMTWGGCSWLRLLKLFYFRRRSGAVDECCCAGSLDGGGGGFQHPCDYKGGHTAKCLTFYCDHGGTATFITSDIVVALFVQCHHNFKSVNKWLLSKE